MTTDYDPIAEQYQRSKLQPWRACIESYTLMALLGDLSGQTAVDVACGDGYYTRRIRAAGARRVYGVDLSPAMIALAQAQERQHGLGIEYMVGDGRDLQIGAEPDVVAAAYFLNYARDRAELGAMCGSIGRCLPPGGRFVAVNQNPVLDFRTAPSYRKYGFETTVGDGPWTEGAPITWVFYLNDGAFSIENYHLDPSVHEEALRAAGFRDIRWHGPRLSLEGESRAGREFWSLFLAHPPITFIECVK